jgi:hypothetical protein
MRMALGIPIVLLAVLGAAPQSAPEDPITYEVASVKRHLLLVTDDGEMELDEGDSARSGDTLRTGSRSAADLEVPARAALFHIGTKTRFRLAHHRPGVLIEVERGSLRAVFGTLPQGTSSERLVTTPSAVLAVRGTDYGVEVERDGDTTVVVFEGTVEVSDAAGVAPPVRVGAGQSTRVRKGRAPGAPAPHRLTPDAWDRGRRLQGTNPGSGGQNPGPGGPVQQPGSGRPGAGSSQSQKSQGGSTRHGG